MPHAVFANFTAIVLVMTSAFCARAPGVQETYRQAGVDSMGVLQVVTSTGRIIRPVADPVQVAVEQVAVSADGRTVGWVALYPGCCTSYPLPLKLLLLQHGEGRTVVVSNDLPVWQWAFTADSRGVVIRQSPVHGPAPMHYELRDVRTGRVLDAFDADTAARASPPAWMRTIPQPPREAP